MRSWNAYGAAVSEGNWGVLEDGFFLDPKIPFFAVIDGFGGAASNEGAIHDTVLELRKKNSELEARWSGAISCLEKQVKLLEELNSVLVEKNKGIETGCSLAVAEIWGGNILAVSSVGECSVHLVREQIFYPLLLPQADILDVVRKPRVPNQVLGIFPKVAPESREVHLRKGDILLLCTGGVPVEEEEWKTELITLLGLRLEGENLAQIAERCVGLSLGEGVAKVNQGLVLVEI